MPEPRPEEHSSVEETLWGLKAHGTKFEYFVFRYRRWLALGFFLLALIWTLLLTQSERLGEPRMSPGLQAAHAIGLTLYSYANDHNGHYPEGTSSTQVFQQLIDGGYVTDPAVFYLHGVSGKSVGSGKVLRPENVCWDFTAGTRQDDPSNVPLIYSTGCKVDYTPGKKVRVPDSAPFGNAGMVVFYVNNSAAFITTQNGEADLFGPAYDPKGKSYTQLTP